MIRIVGNIKPNERSQNVANLHTAIRRLGQRVDPVELREQRAGETTIQLVREFQKRMNIQPREDLLVDEATAAAINAFLADQAGGEGGEPILGYDVSGHVTGPDGRPASGLTVMAYDQDLRTREELGRAQTGGRGEYRIIYTRDRFSRAERGEADLVIEVAAPDGTVLHTAAPFFRAPRHATVDVTLTSFGKEPELDRLVRLVQPLLEGQNVGLDGLEENEKFRDLTFLTAETGLRRDRLMTLVVAFRLQQRSKIAVWLWYAALRTETISLVAGSADQAPSVEETTQRAWSLLPSTSPEAVERALRRAVELSYIAAPSDEQTKAAMKQYRELVRQESANAPSKAREVADIAGVDKSKIEIVFDAVLAGGSRQEVIERLRQAKLADHEIHAVDATLTLHDLTLGDKTVTKHLRGQADHPDKVRTLARLNPSDWDKVLTGSKAQPPDYIGGTKPEEKRQNYAKLLAQRFQRAYPTAAFAGGLERALKSDRKPPLTQGPAILKFLDTHPDFELASTSVDGYLATKASADKAFTSELKAVQRVYKVASSYEASSTLLQDGIHSARKIHRMGKSKFVGRYANREGFTAESAARTWQSAANTEAAVVSIIGNLRATQTANDVEALQVQLADGFPNIANLFGAADVCECEDCRSIFSPAAYLADVLMFLADRDSVSPAVSVKDVLFQRRPDLAYLELSCDNSFTPLPYVDLANEVLEDHVAPWKLFDLPLALEPQLTEGPATVAVRNAFAAALTKPVTLSIAAKVSAKDDLDSWVVRDGELSYRVAKIAGALRVSLLRQTRGTAEELAANPEYVNEDAYAILQTATYPMALPFGLATEEVRAYLDKAGVKRAELMEVLRGPAGPNDPSLADIGAEALGIGSAEQPILFTADTANQFKYWGETSNTNAISALSHVDTFLNRTGLEYDDLQRMLSLDFVNPGGAIQIHHLDASCDTAQKRLQVLDAPALDRIHRFLRFWRKLGWKMWEVDLVIMHGALGAGAISTTLAERLWPFIKLLKRFKALTVEQLASFYADMNTKAKFTTAFHKTEPSLYEKTFLSKRAMNPLDPAFAIAVVSAPTLETIEDHLAPIFAATRVSEADLGTLRALAQPGSITPWLPDSLLTLANLSFLYRHSTLAKLLRIKIADWSTLLFLLQRNVFASPAATLEVVEMADRIKSSGLTTDALSYILSANLLAKSADTERNATAMLTTLRQALQTIAADNDAADLPTSIDELSTLLAAKLQVVGWPGEAAQAAVDAITGRLQARAVAPTMPAAFVFPAAITAAMPISYDDTATAITFTGFMTDAQRTTLLTDATLAAVTANADYQKAINDLHAAPRLLIKFYDPSFEAPLAVLPASVGFSAQLPPELAAKIAFDTEEAELSFSGVMTDAEKAALDALSADLPYGNAVLALFNAPRTGVFPPEDLWLTAADLAFPLANETNPLLDNRPANLHQAAQRLLDHLKQTLSRLEVIDEFAGALRSTPAIGETLSTSFPLFGGPPRTLLELYTDPAFIASSAALTPATDADEFEGYYWMHRGGLLLRTLKVTLPELDWMIRTSAQTGVLDLATLPLRFDDDPPAVGAIDRLLDLSDLIQFHHARSDEFVSLIAMIDRLLGDPGYTAALFGAETELLTEWPAADVATLVGSLDLAFPGDYAKWAGWSRLKKAFPMLARLNANASAILALAAPGVGPAESESVKQLLRSKYEEEQYLELSKNVQDILRERKRDSLVAYLLTLPMPPDAPTHKWENANDLFAYYLVDVEMCSCQLSSRIVQASGAAQLFVQRCFMGLEPKVRVSVDEDDSWLQWQWMRYYRVWEANRRVFAYPENYAEPELRLDKTEIFKALEDELLQGEVNKDNVETAFLHYVEGLDNVAQLEIAGTWQEDKNRTLHVFGRTPGSEPRTYYYRRFEDRRRWTGWEKVECDIKSDYLVPLIHNDRLHLVWPEFREEPQQPTATDVPVQGDTNVPLDKPQKRMNVFLAVTEFRSGKWGPKKVSQAPVASGYYTDDNPFDRSRYAIFPLDFTGLFPEAPFLLLVYDTDTHAQNLFELAGCRGYPEPYRPEDASGYLSFLPLITRFERDDLQYMKNAETSNQIPGHELVPQYNVFMQQRILDLTPGFFKITYPHYMSFFDKLYFLILSLIHFTISDRRRLITLGTFYDWFYADKLRTFFVQPKMVSEKLGGTEMSYPELVDLTKEILALIFAGNAAGLQAKLQPLIAANFQFRLEFDTFYHPLTCLFAKELYASGVEGLMARKTQFADKKLHFDNRYSPTFIVEKPYPEEVVDFEPDGAYSLYNWELFFHAPLMIATRLSRDQRFEDAVRWFHFIFDPTGGNDRDPITNLPAPSPQKFWITKPFFQRQSAEYEAQRIENLMNLLASDPQNPTPTATIKAIIDAVIDWRRNPFDPHVVAQYRTVAYQKMTVMKYVDNLIAWGDQRFRMDTMESVNEATQLYVLAAEILGQRPRRVPPIAKPPAETFSELQKKLDAFSNALVDFENVVPPLPPEGDDGGQTPAVPSLLYFCIPPNDQMLRYWDTVADRLYKIRHCMNIEGVVRQLSLFAPPIDPMALVKAVAGGLDIGAALADLDAPLPHYRFQTMLQKANELVGDLKALSAALLAALEKKDAEALARLRQGQEMSVLKAAREVREKQIDDAQLVIDGLQKNKELITIRRDYYNSREFMNTGETAAIALHGVSLGVHTVGTVLDILGGGIALIPDFKVGASGFGGSPHLAVEPPTGKKISDGLALGARAAYQLSTILDKTAGIATTMAGYERRDEDWQNNVALANKELEQMAKQIASAELKKALAEKELANHDLNIDNAKAVDTFMRGKYTNQELYQWMITQISQTYFQTYKLAYDVAKRAERCYRHEVGVEDSSFVQYGYWDGMKSGLQSGERLQLDLRRLESAYFDGNRRELECTKNISLAMINPQALLALKEKGVCVVDLPEELFDFDYAGHYFRRIKSVSISIPCVAGPHTTITCSLRLLKNSLRINTSLGSQYEHNNDEGVLTDDDRFRESHLRVKSIATSTGQNDSGLFELSFRDERYLPFEGAGAISAWQIELTQAPELRQFSYDTISDVILHLRYTAREDAGQFKAAAVDYMKNVIALAAGRMPLRRMFDLRREFPTEWYAFLHPSGTLDKTLQINIRHGHFPYFAQHGDINIAAVWLFIRSDNTDPLVASLELPTVPAETINLPASATDEEFHVGSKTDLADLLDESQPWRLRLRKDPGTFNGITDAEIEEAFLLVQYTT